MNRGTESGRGGVLANSNSNNYYILVIISASAAATTWALNNNYILAIFMSPKPSPQPTRDFQKLEVCLQPQPQPPQPSEACSATVAPSSLFKEKLSSASLRSRKRLFRRNICSPPRLQCPSCGARSAAASYLSATSKVNVALWRQAGLPKPQTCSLSSVPH